MNRGKQEALALLLYKSYVAAALKRNVSTRWLELNAMSAVQALNSGFDAQEIRAIVRTIVKDVREEQRRRSLN